MKIIVACDSYKGCMTSKEVAQHMERAIHQVDPSIRVLSYTMADGGEGTAAAFVTPVRERWFAVRPPTLTGGAWRLPTH